MFVVFVGKWSKWKDIGDWYYKGNRCYQRKSRECYYCSNDCDCEKEEYKETDCGDRNGCQDCSCELPLSYKLHLQETSD